MRRGIVAVEQHNGIRHIIHWRSPLAANPDIGARVCLLPLGRDPAHVCFFAFQLSLHGLNLGACAGVQGRRRATLGETPCVLGADDGRCKRRPSERVQHRSRGLDTPLTSLLSIRGRRRGRRGPRYRWATPSPRRLPGWARQPIARGAQAAPIRAAHKTAGGADTTAGPSCTHVTGPTRGFMAITSLSGAYPPLQPPLFPIRPPPARPENWLERIYMMRAAPDALSCATNTIRPPPPACLPLLRPRSPA